MDKNGTATDAWFAMGFSHVELGTVTPDYGQPGNDRPRLWRIPPAHLINKMGFNNYGVVHLAKQLQSEALPRRNIGVSIGKAKGTPLSEAYNDYQQCARILTNILAPWTPMFTTINVSSPNTEGLRSLQLEGLAHIIETVRGEMPYSTIAVKLSPDLADPDVVQVVQTAREAGAHCFIAVNTTSKPDKLRPPGAPEGGLSGPILKKRALAVTRLIRRTHRTAVIIGVGGICTADDAYARIRAGANLLQIYTALVYRGPGIIKEIVNGLAARLKRDKLTLVEAIGVEA
jgi:dihydroorotate dehydrogenase